MNNAMAGPDAKMTAEVQEELDSGQKEVFTKMGETEEKPIFKPTAPDQDALQQSRVGIIFLPVKALQEDETAVSRASPQAPAQMRLRRPSPQPRPDECRIRVGRGTGYN